LTWAATRQDVPTRLTIRRRSAVRRSRLAGEWFLDTRDVFNQARCWPASSTSASRCARTRLRRRRAGQPGQLGREPQHPDRAGSGRFRRLGRRRRARAGHLGRAQELPGTRDQGGPDGQRLVDKFDFELDEQCQEYSECDSFTEFTKSGKVIFDVEYKTNLTLNCSQFGSLSINASKRTLTW